MGVGPWNMRQARSRSPRATSLLLRSGLPSTAEIQAKLDPPMTCSIDSHRRIGDQVSAGCRATSGSRRRCCVRVVRGGTSRARPGVSGRAACGLRPCCRWTAPVSAPEIRNPPSPGSPLPLRSVLRRRGRCGGGARRAPREPRPSRVATTKGLTGVVSLSGRAGKRPECGCRDVSEMVAR